MFMSPFACRLRSELRAPSQQPVLVQQVVVVQQQELPQVVNEASSLTDRQLQLVDGRAKRTQIIADRS